MIDALNFLITVISSVLVLLFLTAVTLWVYHNLVKPQLEETKPEALAAAENITQALTTAAKRPDRIDDSVLSDTYIQLTALADITANLYTHYSQATAEAKRINGLMKHFSEDGNKIALTNRVKFVAGCQGLDDCAMTALIANEAALVVPAYVNKVYIALAKAAEVSKKTARGYRETAEQAFREVELIRARVGEIRTHIQTHNAAQLVADINRELDKTAAQLKIDGEPKTIADYVEAAR